MLNLVQLQERLKDVPMQALMQYANGMNAQIPPFLALGELNRRKKMQEAAAAEQAQQMAGAPTIKDQIEQATGLMSLQQQQMPQQAAPQQMPQQMPPMGMAGGGLARLPMRPDMFRRRDYAGGGIVAFAGDTDGSFVQSSPGFYELRDEQEDARPMSREQKMLMEVIKKIQDMKTTEQLRAEAGLGERPDDRAERLRALQEEQAKLASRDTVARRVLALDPMRIGKSMDEYFNRKETAEKDIASRIAEIKDLKAKAEYDAKVGNVDKSRAESIEALNKQASLIKDLGELGLKDAQTRAQEQGKTTNLTYLTEVILEAKRNPTPENIAKRNAAIEAAGYATPMAGQRLDITQQGLILEQERAAQKAYADLFDPKKMLYDSTGVGKDIREARNLDKKQGTGKQNENLVRLREYNRIRIGLRLPPVNELPGSTPQSDATPTSTNASPPPPPRDYVIVR